MSEELNDQLTPQPPYDAVTPNGIMYMTRIYSVNAKYQLVVTTLDAMQPMYLKAVAGTAVSGYRIGSRELSYRGMSVAELMRKYLDLLNQKLAMEKGTAPRRAMTIVPRDV